MFRLFFFVLLSMGMVCLGQQSEFLCAKKLGGTTAAQCHGRNMAVDNSGNIYLTGFLNGTVDFDPGTGTTNLASNGPGGYLAKYDSSGNYQWAFKLGNYGFTVCVDDSMNIYYSGTFYGKTDFDPGPDTAYLTSDTDFANVFIAKYTSNLEFVWARSIYGSYGTVTNGKIIALDKFNNIFIAGLFEDTAYFKNIQDSNYLVAKGWVNAFFAKYDTDGNFVWARSLEGQDSSKSHIRCVATDTIGNCYITGQIDPNINNDFDPGADTSYLITTGIYNDGFVAKYDKDGNYVWSFALDGAIQLISYTLTTDKNNDIYIAGSMVGDTDFDPDTGIANLNPIGNYYTPFFAKYNNEGSYLWAKKITSYGTDEIYNMAVDSSGKILVTGYFTDDSADFDPGPDVKNLTHYNSNVAYDIFWALYDSSGNFVLAQSIYGKGENVAHDISFYKNNLLLTGHFYDTMYFDDSAIEYITSLGWLPSDNAFFAKYQLDFTTGENSIKANSESIKIYPNPFNSQFTVILSSNQIATITIYNIFVQSIYKELLTNHQSIINFFSFPSGVYFLSSNINNQFQTFKIIKM